MNSLLIILFAFSFFQDNHSCTDYKTETNCLIKTSDGYLDSLYIEPKDLKYNRKKQLVLKVNRKTPFSGFVEGEILFSKIVENMLVHNKENHCFFDNFCSYSILSGQANDYEPDMNRIALGPHIFVKGQVVLGKEVGEWKFRYSYKDLDFLFIIANYKNGKLDGTAKFYKPDGRLYQEAEFEKGKLVLRIWYNEDGEIIYKDYYENDKLIRTEQYAKDPRSF